MRHRCPKFPVLGALCVALAIVWAAPAHAETKTFEYTGGEQTFTVPAGVTSLEVLAIGGSGGSSGAVPGGLGARVTADLAVTPGQTLYVIVGGDGQTDAQGGSGGFNGGGDGEGATADAGGGGGATDIRTTPLSAGLGTDTRLIVAGAGGGAGATGPSGAGGAGGNAGEDGAAGEGSLAESVGRAGTLLAGGAGGEGCEQPGGEGAGGFLAFGGDGGDTTSSGTSGPGGGGGGGLNGGGGGGGACNAGSSGGGGGSSLVPDGGEESSGLSEDVPLVELTYEIPPAPPGPAPTATTPTPASVPNTILGARPGKTVRTSKKKVKVRFAFSSDVAGATFQCKLDRGRFAGCTSPKAYRLGPGKHNFSVRAVGPGGTDPSPAKLRFRIRKTK
jgi:hypothetical protein